ncbi:MAG: hypothetical protein V4586_04695 [Pseudomonadota bacterium]
MDSEAQQFRLFCLLHGQTGIAPLCLAQLPLAVTNKLGWAARNVFVSLQDAQKIRHHPMHGMDAVRGLQLPMVIRQGDYYQSQKRGTELQIEVVLHEFDNPKRAYFLVLSRNKEDTGVFIRTFYFSSELSRNKMKNATRLLIKSTSSYFK